MGQAKGLPKGAFEASLTVVEAIIAAVIVVVIVLALYATVLEIFSAVTSGSVNAVHDSVLSIVDLVIIMLLAADLLRTIVVSVREGRMPARSIVEIALLVIVREMVATSLEGFNYVTMLALSASFLAVAGSYIIITKYAEK
jgi:uncharacterized membrane protein (DUF373 family)